MGTALGRRGSHHAWQVIHQLQSAVVFLQLSEQDISERIFKLGEREYRLSCHNSATISCQKLIKQNQDAEVKTGSLTQEEGISSTNFT